MVSLHPMKGRNDGIYLLAARNRVHDEKYTFIDETRV